MKQLLIPYIGKTVLKMLEDKMKVAKASSSLSSEEEEIEEIEIDVSEWFHTVTEDTITRTAFGQSYDDGRAVCHLQAQQMTFAAEAFRKVLIPGYRSETSTYQNNNNIIYIKTYIYIYILII